METFDQAMRAGQAQYQDVIGALTTAGYPATFTQTGGMNAALEVLLEGGWALLITDAAEALSWERRTQRGWGVGLFAPDERYLVAPQAFAEAPDTDTDTLLRLVDEVLREGAARTAAGGRTD